VTIHCTYAVCSPAQLTAASVCAQTGFFSESIDSPNPTGLGWSLVLLSIFSPLVLLGLGNLVPSVTLLQAREEATAAAAAVGSARRHAAESNAQMAEERARYVGVPG
jgi:hypothetical protein